MPDPGHLEQAVRKTFSKYAAMGGCFGCLISLRLLFIGFGGLLRAWEAMSPLDMTYTEYLAQKPKSRFINLREIRLRPLQATINTLTLKCVGTPLHTDRKLGRAPD